MIHNRKSLLLTGPPGCGKSSLLNEMLYFNNNFEIINKSIKEKKISLFSFIKNFDSQKKQFIKSNNNTFHNTFPQNLYYLSLFIKKFLQSDYFSIGRPKKRKYKDLTKVLKRLRIYLTLSQSYGLPMLWEQSSFWHKLIFTGDKYLFEMLPKPDITICIIPTSSFELFQRRTERKKSRDQKKDARFNYDQYKNYLSNEISRWELFCNVCDENMIPTLKLEGDKSVKEWKLIALNFLNKHKLI